MKKIVFPLVLAGMLLLLLGCGRSPQSGNVRYTAVFKDETGAPVEGCVVNFCTDEACVPVTSDAKGIAVFEGEAKIYHLDVIRVPQGYAPAEDVPDEIGPEAASVSIPLTEVAP